MNGKKAKRLRKEARTRTTGKPWVDYQGFRFGIGMFSNFGTCRMHPDCGRAVYKRLKRESA